jgi:N6-adenosine-specific RNA methylase IME4
LLRAFELAAAWGFAYTAVRHQADYFTGLGYWTRANPEQCLLATRGKPPRRSKSVRRLVVDRRRQHSHKPDVVRERIEALVDGPYLELFARETKPGWDCWGDQVALFDAGGVATRRQPSRLTGSPELDVAQAID